MARSAPIRTTATIVPIAPSETSKSSLKNVFVWVSKRAHVAGEQGQHAEQAETPCGAGVETIGRRPPRCGGRSWDDVPSLIARRTMGLNRTRHTGSARLVVDSFDDGVDAEVVVCLRSAAGVHHLDRPAASGRTGRLARSNRPGPISVSTTRSSRGRRAVSSSASETRRVTVTSGTRREHRAAGRTIYARPHATAADCAVRPPRRHDQRERSEELRAEAARRDHARPG